MSDLQTSLLGIGACVVAGVYLFNTWQERQFRRRTEEAFAREHADVLMPESAPPEVANAERTEPKLETPLETPPAAAPLSWPTATRARTAIAIDPVIDYVVEVELNAPRDGMDLYDELIALTADWGKPAQVAGYDTAAGEWRASETGSGKPHLRLRFALQMCNRAGCIDVERLNAFRAAVLEWAARNEGSTKCLDTADAHALAVQLDRFCAEVDIAIGINVVSTDGSPFSGTKIRALAEAGGLKLESDGVFYLKSDNGDTLFTLDNHEPMPFVPEQMKALVTSGVTFLLDVPRVADALRRFDGMLATARNCAATLGGTLVDDNRTALTEPAIDKIRHQLTGILAKMEAGQIAAGGARALRLFS